MSQSGSKGGSSGPQSGILRAVLVPGALLILTAVLAAGPWELVSPVPPARVVPAWAFDPTPVRRPSRQPEISMAGYRYRCSDCHSLFPSPAEPSRPLTQHRDINLRHGINDRCFNCHHVSNRDALVDDWGQEIPWDEPFRLCAKCHGPVYRDWLHGVHGRTNGYWDESRGPLQRCKCVECHDPHVPPFPPMLPAPPPYTLRVGDVRLAQEPPAAVDPLRVYQQPGAPGSWEKEVTGGVQGSERAAPVLRDPPATGARPRRSADE